MDLKEFKLVKNKITEQTKLSSNLPVGGELSPTDKEISEWWSEHEYMKWKNEEEKLKAFAKWYTKGGKKLYVGNGKKFLKAIEDFRANFTQEELDEMFKELPKNKI